MPFCHFSFQDNKITLNRPATATQLYTAHCMVLEHNNIFQILPEGNRQQTLELHQRFLPVRHTGRTLRRHPLPHLHHMPLKTTVLKQQRLYFQSHSFSHDPELINIRCTVTACKQPQTITYKYSYDIKAFPAVWPHLDVWAAAILL